MKLGLIGILSVAFLVSACATPPGATSSNTAASKPAPPARIVAGLRGSPKVLTDRTSPIQPGHVPGLDALQDLVVAGLVTAKDDGVIVPQLAEAVPSVDNGRWKVFPEGRMQTSWTIRPNVTWQDGTPLTTDDLLFTTEVEQDPEMGFSSSAAAYELIEGVEATDARTVTVTWKQPYIEADFMFSAMFALPMPKHLLEPTYRSDKSNFFALPYWTDAFVGSGPFRVKQWVPDSLVVLSAYDQYVLGRPKIDEIEVRFVPDPNTLMVNMLADGQLTLGRALSLAQALQVQEQWPSGHVNTRPYGWLPLNPQFINPDPVVVSNLQFRRAILEAIDRQQLVESLQAGRTAVADSWLDPNLPEHAAIAPSIVRYPYDPQTAIRAITDLGYTRQPDGFFYDAQNQKLSVQIQTTAQNAMHEPASASIADMLQRVGVAVSVDIVPPQRAQDREYRATFPSFDLIELATDLSPRMVNRWHSRQTPLPQNRFTVTGNSSRYQNPALDGAIDHYLTTIPRDARLQALAEMIHIQTDQLSAMGLIHTVTPTLVDNRLQNVTGKGSRSTESWNAQDWELTS